MASQDIEPEYVPGHAVSLLRAELFPSSWRRFAVNSECFSGRDRSPVAPPAGDTVSQPGGQERCQRRQRQPVGRGLGLPQKPPHGACRPRRLSHEHLPDPPRPGTAEIGTDGVHASEVLADDIHIIHYDAELVLDELPADVVVDDRFQLTALHSARAGCSWSSTTSPRAGRGRSCRWRSSAAPRRIPPRPAPYMPEAADGSGRALPRGSGSPSAEMTARRRLPSSSSGTGSTTASRTAG